MRRAVLHNRVTLTNSLRHNELQLRRLCETKSWDYDVCVCGGNVVGNTLTNLLMKKAGGSLKICVLERNPKPPTAPKIDSAPDVRVYALSPKSIEILDAAGSWQYISSRSKAYDAMQIWEANGPGYVKFSSKEINQDYLGKIAEDVNILHGLINASKDLNLSIDYIYGATVKNIHIKTHDSYATGPCQLTYETLTNGVVEKKEITTRLLVGADGGNSTVRKLAGYPSWGWSYGQDALVATIKVDSATSTAWQTYLSTGPLAVLPLWDNYCSIVWSGPSSQTRWLQSLPDDEFLIELNKALEIPLKTSSFSDFIPKANDCDSPSSSSYREEFIKKGFQALRKPIEIFSSEVAAVLDTAVSAARLNTEPPSTPPRVVSIESKRLSFPLQLQQSSRYTSSRIALIGDSAHTIHPQAGQGLNMGLRDADDLATVILEGLSVGCDIGDSELLDRYGRRSFRRNLAMLGVVDTINSLFAYQNADGDDAKLREFLKTYSSPQGFANHQSIIASLRSVGMLGVQYLTPLKKRIASYAMGI